MTKPPIFNTYDEQGNRQTQNGSRSSRIADEAIIYNLRFRWPKELEPYTDVQIVNEYDDYAMSDWFGNNDERFLEWMATVEP